MKLIARKNKKIVEYFGLIFEVSEKVTHIATDSDGEVFAYYSRPILSSVYWVPNGGTNCYHIGITLGRVDLEGENWQTTLKEV